MEGNSRATNIVNLSSLDGSNGFRMDGVAVNGYSGRSISNAGDINGDGFSDVIIGAPAVNTNYVVFGKAAGFDPILDLSHLDGSNGFRLDGPVGDFSGLSVSTAGDVNGDNFDDVIIGTYGANSSYVVFGKAAGFGAALDLSSLDGNNGFVLNGTATDDLIGRQVSNAGDVNGDGFDDVMVSAIDFSTYPASGSSYVVFGKASGFDAKLDLSGVNGNNGLHLDGATAYSVFDLTVSDAGDVNGDGFDDEIVGSAGASYVVFGKASGFDAELDLANLDDSSGFRLDGATNEAAGVSVSGGGDINGDGFDDLIIGAPGSDVIGDDIGATYVVFGRSSFGGGGLPEIVGTFDDDLLKGTSAPETFKAGGGNDRLIGRGGADEFHGEDGNDFILVPDLGFDQVDGGVGNDVLQLGGKDLTLDLTDYLNKIQSVETICLYGRGDNTVVVTSAEVKDLSDTTDTLKLHGNAGDQVILEGNWTDEGGHGFYHTYSQDDAVVLVGMNMTAVIAV